MGILISFRFAKFGQQRKGVRRICLNDLIWESKRCVVNELPVAPPTLHGVTEDREDSQLIKRCASFLLYLHDWSKQAVEVFSDLDSNKTESGEVRVHEVLELLGSQEDNAFTEWEEEGRTGTQATTADIDAVPSKDATQDDRKELHIDQTAEGNELHDPWLQGVSDAREAMPSVRYAQEYVDTVFLNRWIDGNLLVRPLIPLCGAK